jgi:phosphoribosylanthranilate isomerase
MSPLNLSFLKICGITRKEDAAFACNLGVSAIGFVAFSKSNRFLSSVDVHKIISQVIKKYPKTKRVGVFVNEDFSTIIAYLKSGINVVQLHGDETVDYVCKLRKVILMEHFDAEIWQAIRLRTTKDVILSKKYSVDKYLVDSFVKGKAGGTGIRCDWDLAEFAVNALSKPVILAGGLTSKNICKAVRKVHPFGIDISPGVESSPGVKDHNLLRELISICKTNWSG